MQDREKIQSLPAVSVLMCVHNGAAFVIEAIESILSQSFEDFEFIIVNDASTDTTRIILERFCLLDPRVKIITNSTNKGLTKSLNIGLQEVRGKYVARMDADDRARKDRLFVQYHFMEEHQEVAACGSGVTLMDENGKILGEKRLAQTYEQIYKQMLFNNQFIHSTLFFRTQILEKEGGYDERFVKSQDYELMFRLASRRRVENLNEALVFFRTHEASLSWIGTGQQKDAIRARWFAITKYGFPFFRGVFHIALRSVWLMIPREFKLWYGQRKIDTSLPVESEDGSKNILGVFFTYGVSLATWQKQGILTRELMIYRGLLSQFDAVYLFTYGSEEASLVETLRQERIFVIGKKPGWSNWWYSLCLPYVRKQYVKRCTVYKTNQVFGSWSAVFSSFLFKVPLIVRAGFVLSTNLRKQNTGSQFLARMVERIALWCADRVIVTTEEIRNTYEKYNTNIFVIPNFVDTSVFLPRNNETLLIGDIIKLLFIGRLSKEKNLNNLIFAIKDMSNVELTLIGDGDEKNNLELLSQGSLSKIIFRGKVEHRELPKYFENADVFVLPSLYEGNPKVILEAMAAGVPILASNVRGINTLLNHQETGFLVGTGFEDIKRGLLDLLEHTQLARTLAVNARKEVEQYRFEAILQKEKSVYEKYL